jgi:hypothetical protein
VAELNVKGRPGSRATFAAPAATRSGELPGEGPRAGFIAAAAPILDAPGRQE